MGPSNAVVEISSRRVFLASIAAATGILLTGRFIVMPVWLVGAEVFATILGLFLFGSFRYRIHKNAWSYGMLCVILATFCGVRTSAFHREIADAGWGEWAKRHLFSFRGLDDLVHADTMLFILGLTFLVSAIAQTRLLEAVTFFLLRRNRGRILPTVIAVTAIVALASGILDGVSMIGLTIRTLVIILCLAAAPVSEIRYAVMVCTVVTTICGIWLAYGEPPNLIMKANLHPHLDNLFFLRYCAPAAVACYLVIAWQLRRRLGGLQVDLDRMDVLDANADTVRFLQASRHGEVIIPIELVEDSANELGDRSERVVTRLRKGEPLGAALVRESVPEAARRKLLGRFVSEDLAESLDRHYLLAEAGDAEGSLHAERAVDDAIAALAPRRARAQWIGALAMVPFIAMLIWHGFDHRIPLFVASFAGLCVAMAGIIGIPKIRALALREAWHEYAEYYFLFPLFLSITLLTKIGFFDQMQTLISAGVSSLGETAVAIAQFMGCTFLSAILDNNVVADFGSRALHGLGIATLHLFALAQIAGYALGGCWTHIGSAQSVVAYAFIQRDIDGHYTPLQWVKEMTPVIAESCVVLALIVCAEGILLRRFLESGMSS